MFSISLIAMALIGLALVGIALGETHYVSTTGDDNDPGTAESPWRNPAFGAGKLDPGDTLIIMSGEYILRDFGEDMIRPASGLDGAWITIRGEDGAALVGTENLFAAIDLSGTSYLRLENLEIRSDGENPFRDGINAWDPAKHVVMEGLHIHHLDGFGVDLRDVEDIHILNSTIEYCGFGAVGGAAGETGWTNITILNCSLSYSGHYYQGTPGPSPYDRPDGFGIEPSPGPIEIADTIAQHNRGDGLDSKAANTTIHHCIVAHNSCDGIKLWGGGTVIENCIVYDVGDGNYSPTPWAGLVIGTLQSGATFRIVNTAIIDSPLREAYPMYVQYDDREIDVILEMKNCIVSHGHGAAFIGPSVEFEADHCLFFRPGIDYPVEWGDALYSSADVEGGAIGPGNLARDPLFEEYGALGLDGYELSVGSPALDSATGEGAPEDDLLHRPRPEGAGFDMGPLERGSNDPPKRPDAPDGPSHGATQRPLCYSIEATDPEGDLLSYAIDWGDGATDETEITPSGSAATLEHRWEEEGVYSIRAKASDIHDASSEWSLPLDVEVVSPHWEGAGGLMRSRPFILGDSVYLEGDDGALWEHSREGWRTLGGLITSPPWAIQDGEGSIHVLVRGSDEALWDCIPGPSGPTWISLAGRISAPPSAALGPDGTVIACVRGNDEAVWMRDAGPSGHWETLGGRIIGQPALVYDGSSIHALVKGMDGQLWHNVDGEWRPAGGSITSPPRATLLDGEILTLVRGEDEGLWQNRIGIDGESSWSSLGGGLAPADGTYEGDPMPVVADGNLYVFVRAMDDNLWEWSLDWIPRGGLIQSLSAGPSLEVAASDQSGSLWLLRGG